MAEKSANTPKKKESNHGSSLDQDQERIMKLMEEVSIAGGKVPGPVSEAEKRHQFWETQPVPKMGETVTTTEPLEPPKKKEDIKAEPYDLPSGFKWVTLDISDEDALIELYKLLNENYVEDDDNMFRFDYSPGFLNWALKPPGWKMEWHAGVRVEKSNKLVGFISAIPAEMVVNGSPIKTVEINFLCVHKKLRSKRMAPVLISEITRRVNLFGIFQAVYTAGIVLPKPIGSCRYWHRSINPKKLIDVKFSYLSNRMTMARTIKLYKLPDEVKLLHFRAMEEKDIANVSTMLNTYLSQFKIHPVFTEEEVRHWFLPRKDIVDAYVTDDPTSGLTSFCSYYTLPSTVVNHPNYKNIRAAYSFYNIPSDTVPIKTLMQDALITAKLNNYDVFNALDLMANKEFLEELKFGMGDGNLQYYLFNFKCPMMTPNEIGLILQ